MEYQDTALTSFIGSGMAIADTVNTPFYMDDLIDYAHAATTDDFNREAVAYAIATKKINHMFEWGSAGINPVPGGPNFNPNTSTARLWRHTIKGTHTTKVIGFDFKPSKVPVPLPTPSTEVDLAEWKESMPRSRHVFHWKAKITELGIPVVIKPRNAQAMFVPLGPNPRTTDPRALKRGFIFTDSTLVSVPGREVAGNFSMFWASWWGGVGLPKLQAKMQSSYIGDVYAESATWRNYKGRKRRKAYGFQMAYADSKAELMARSRARAAAAVEMTKDERRV